MTERRGTKGLELWCRRMTEGYPGVKIDNMTTSWRDGLAFCAIIHHFRPDLIEFSKLNKDDVYHNNELAFRVAEQYLGIPALLEPEDMVEYPVPDRLSILTYLSQFYQAFSVTQGKSGARIAPKRAQTSPDHGIVSPTSTSPPTKVAFIGAGKIRRESCAKCSLPVFIAERLNVGKLLYHRTCFRCARCNSQLTLANYYETENSEFCCEVCPDEEKITKKEIPEKSVLLRSMSDEEKTATLSQNYSDEPDAYSAQFENDLELPSDESLRRNFTLPKVENSEFTKARSQFFKSQIEDSATDSGNDEDDIPPDLPKTEPPKLEKSEPGHENINSPTESGRFDSGFPNNNVNNISDSISEQTDNHFVTKDNNSGSDGIVRARMRLFENNEEIEKSDVNRYSQDKVPLKSPEKHKTKLVSLDELEDFDSISEVHEKIVSNLSNNEDEKSKQDDKAEIPIEVKIENSKMHSDDNVENKDLKEEDDTESNLRESSVSHQSLDDSVVPASDCSEKNNDSVIEVLDSGEEKQSVTEATSIYTIEDSSESVNKDTSLPTVTINSTSDENSYLTADDVLSPKPMDSSDDLTTTKKGYKTAYEITLPEESVIATPEDSRQGKEEKDYPNQLNPFGDEDQDNNDSLKSPISLNPFGDDDDDEEAIPKPNLRPVPSPRFKKKKILPTDEDKALKGTPKQLSHVYIERVSVNPFESDDEDNDEDKMKKPPLPADRKKKVSAPRISLNPFWSEDEEHEEEHVKLPVPIPRMSRTSGAPEPKPRESVGLSASNRSTFGSNTSLSSVASSARKKKQAPKPPGFLKTENDSVNSSPSHSVSHSPRLTPRYGKSKKAPLPPSFASTPLDKEKSNQLSSNDLSPVGFRTLEDTQNRENRPLQNDIEQEKNVKDEMNRNRQSQILNNLQSPSSSENSSSISAPNKSTYGKWKRRKGQAPSRPIPQKRSIKCLPMTEIRRELDIIEIQQQGLEKQGVRLEQIIREKCEGTEDSNPDETLPIEVEDLILQLFELVNEKNELFRKQAELMYLRRQQRLEEEHADVEYQIRCLMLQPEVNKTDSDKAREEELINRLVDIVERRNEIIECLEMDRVREAEEDDSINNQLNLYTLKRDGDTPKSEDGKKEKKKHKHKKFKLPMSIHTLKHKEKHQKVDIDKDIDEAETNTSTLEKKKKKKFNLF